MAISRTKKEETLEKLKKVFTDGKSVVFVHAKGVSGNDTTALRDHLVANDVSYKVAKKTLISKAFEGKGIDGDCPELSGEIAVALGDDEIAPARSIQEFASKTEGDLQIVGGVFENKFMDKQAMTEIATIPTTEVLYSKLLLVWTAPVRSFAVGLSKLAEQKA